MNIWQEGAACLGDPNPDWLGETLTDKCAAACFGCPVRLQCLTEALPRDRHWDAGIWGGTTVLDRDLIRTGKARVHEVWATNFNRVKGHNDGRHGDVAGKGGLLSAAETRPDTGQGDR